MAEILIIEDERAVRDGYARLFTGEGYKVRLARTGEEGVEKFRARRPDVVLLDVMLPGENGFTACRRLRALDALTPIVFNTQLDGPDDRVRALELGGDDYVLKTDPSAVLVARVARAVARYEAFQRARRPALTITVGRAVVDCCELTVRDGSRRNRVLTRTEFDILRLLAGARGRVFSSEEILDHIRGEGYACDDNTVYVHVWNLRRKLGTAGELIVTQRDAGYKLVK